MSENRRLLLIETSGAVGTVALALGTRIEERSIATPREQTGRVLSLVDELLKSEGLRLADLDAIVFGRGPGSFTGLRVAAAVTQGLSIAAGVPIVAVSSLAGLAQRALAEAEPAGSAGLAVPDVPDCVLCCVDARMGEVYSGCFRFADGLVAAETEEAIGSPEAVAVPLRSYLAVGDGFAAHAEALAGVASAAAGIRPDLMPRAQDLVGLALREMDAGRYLAVDAALPVYLRSADAWSKA